MRGPRRLLVVSLLVLLVLLIVRGHLTTIWVIPRPGIDVEIPIRAADRWLSGGEPYDASAFALGQIRNPPFLYPPAVLPFAAVFTTVPRQLVQWIAVLVMLIAVVASLRRLRIPWLWLPLVLAWPPFSEGILSTNIPVATFLAFVVLFYRGVGSPWRPAPRDVSLPSESAAEVGALSTFTSVVKVSQPHAWIFVLRHRWRAAIGGAIVFAAIALATVPITGTQLWADWVVQVGRASDVNWELGGFALQRLIPAGVALAISCACIVAVWFVPRRDAAPGIGILATIGSLSLHTFGLAFLVPAMLVIRLEIALIAACFIATYSYEGAWAGILLVSATYAGCLFGRESVRAWLSDGPAAWARPGVGPTPVLAGSDGLGGPDTPFDSAQGR